MENYIFETAAMCAIILLYVLRLVYKARKDHEQWKRIDDTWRPAHAARRSTSEFEGKT